MPVLVAAPTTLKRCTLCFGIYHFSTFDTRTGNVRSATPFCQYCLESRLIKKPYFAAAEFCDVEGAPVEYYLLGCYLRLIKELRALQDPLMIFPNIADEYREVSDHDPDVVAAYHSIQEEKPLCKDWFFDLKIQMSYIEFVEEFVAVSGQDESRWGDSVRVDWGICQVTNVPFDYNYQDTQPWPYLPNLLDGMIAENVLFVLPVVFETLMKFKIEKHVQLAPAALTYETLGLRLWKRYKKIWKIRQLVHFWDELASRHHYTPMEGLVFIDSCISVELLQH